LQVKQKENNEREIFNVEKLKINLGSLPQNIWKQYFKKKMTC